VVLEGAGVNAAVTSPAATLALTLMCLKTGDADVAGWFSLPGSVYELDLLPPSLLTLRVLGRALVMWEEVDATEVRGGGCSVWVCGCGWVWVGGGVIVCILPPSHHIFPSLSCLIVQAYRIHCCGQERA
jgi:anaphase-promoting complex subunit 1